MNPRSLRIGAIVVAVLTVIAAGGAYVALNRSATQSTTCSLASTNPLVIDQPEIPDSLDPTAVYTTPGWGIAQQAYQTLVMYNGSQVGPVSATSGLGVNPTGSPGSWMAPLLAKNWSVSPDGFHWNFTMWPGEHFSNGDPLNAYVMWYSLYRGLAMNQPMDFILEENFYAPHVSYYSTNTTIDAANRSLVNVLNNFTSVATVTTPPAWLLQNMTAQNQSFRVLNSTTIQFNTGFGYLGDISYQFLLDQIASPPFAAVDPVYVEAHGGIQLGQPSTWMSNNMLGSGPFVLTSWDPSSGYTLAPNKDYWATSLAANMTWDNNLQPAKSSIDVVFQSDPTIDTANLKSGSASMASFSYIGPTTLQQLKGDSCVNIQPQLPVYGAVSFSPWIYMDQQANQSGQPLNPFTNLSVRAAVVHAINYAQIVQFGFNGNATQWLGPVPPGYPFANPGTAQHPSLPLYQYNLTLAKQEMNASPYPLPTGIPYNINFEYIQSGDWSAVALLLQSDLARIGITLNLVPINIDTLVQEQTFDSNGLCTSTDPVNGGPFYIGMDYYTADYVAPDDATQLNALSYGFYNVCQSEYANATMDQLVLEAAQTNTTANLTGLYQNITALMYYNYTNAWLPVPTSFSVYNTRLGGIVSNPMGSAIPFEMQYNEVYAT
ncbi:MAG TPA: ABC transporter substrate-binding protein [Thermoplasmata archaeon]|nr:ABC transporter substrate-binding protein [Thermoplasmata archaeon]